MFCVVIIRKVLDLIGKLLMFGTLIWKNLKD